MRGYLLVRVACHSVVLDVNQERRVDISEKSWNQIEEYIWKWYPILIKAALLEGEEQKIFIT